MIWSTETTYFKVWNVDEREKYTDYRVSTSEKKTDPADGTVSYINSNWNARALGKCREALKGAEKGDTIIAKRIKMSNEPYTTQTGEKRSYMRINLIDAELRKDSKGNVNPTSTPMPTDDQNGDDEIPF